MNELLEALRKQVNQADEEVEILKVTVKESDIKNVLIGEAQGLPVGIELNRGTMSDETYKELTALVQPVAEKVVIEFLKALSEKLIEEYHQKKLNEEQEGEGWVN